MNNKEKGGIIALLGVAAGALAFWKYKTMPQEDKEKLHAKINETGKKIKEGAQDAGDTLSEKYEKLKDLSSKRAKDIAS